MRCAISHEARIGEMVDAQILCNPIYLLFFVLSLFWVHTISQTPNATPVHCFSFTPHHCTKGVCFSSPFRVLLIHLFLFFSFFVSQTTAVRLLLLRAFFHKSNTMYAPETDRNTITITIAHECKNGSKQ